MDKHLNLSRCSWNSREPSAPLLVIPLDLIEVAGFTLT